MVERRPNRPLTPGVGLLTRPSCAASSTGRALVETRRNATETGAGNTREVSTSTSPAGAAHLLRVLLPDRPGSLGELAAAIGTVGGDIVSFDIVDRTGPPGDESVVDDFVIVLAPDAAVVLYAALADLDGFSVDTLRPYTGVAPTGGGPDLDAAQGSSVGALAVIAGVGAQAFKADWAVVLDQADGGMSTLVGTPGAPVLAADDAAWAPVAGPARLDPAAPWVPAGWASAQTALAAAPIAGTDLVLLVGRCGGPAFRPAEVARLGRLATVASAASTGGGTVSGRR